MHWWFCIGDDYYISCYFAFWLSIYASQHKFCHRPHHFSFRPLGAHSCWLDDAAIFEFAHRRTIQHGRQMMMTMRRSAAADAFRIANFNIYFITYHVYFSFTHFFISLLLEYYFCFIAWYSRYFHRCNFQLRISPSLSHCHYWLLFAFISPFTMSLDIWDVSYFFHDTDALMLTREYVDSSIATHWYFTYYFGHYYLFFSRFYY